MTIQLHPPNCAGGSQPLSHVPFLLPFSSLFPQIGAFPRAHWKQLNLVPNGWIPTAMSVNLQFHFLNALCVLGASLGTRFSRVTQLRFLLAWRRILISKTINIQVDRITSDMRTLLTFIPVLTITLHSHYLELCDSFFQNVTGYC